MSIASKIRKSTDEIKVETVTVAFYGEPGLGKTTLAQMADAPLTLDFDRGIYRAKNRKDTLPISAWSEVEELMSDPSVLAPYKTLVLDTVGRALDFLTSNLITNNTKIGNAATGLNQKGWGVLKIRFASFVAQLRTRGIDLIMVAHQKEDKDGDTRIVRPDIQGGSYGEIMKL